MFASGKTAAVASAANYIEDVFSTYLYTGNDSAQTITNGIDLAGKGGLVWGKSRSASQNHRLYDTARGSSFSLISNATSAESNQGTNACAFNADGFSLSAASGIVGSAGFGGPNYVSWTFRKQPKFFDIVTYTGANTSRMVSHSLGSTPGFVIIKKTSGTSNWLVAARDGTSSGKYTYTLFNSAAGLNLTAAANYTNYGLENSGWITSTGFNPYILSGSGGNDNNNYDYTGDTYIAYLFAHDAGGFGLTGTDNVISCGSITGYNGRAELGYEPQFVLMKEVNYASNWLIYDIMRGWVTSLNGDSLLRPNTSGAEATGGDGPTFDATGFNFGQVGETYIYIAIRRGPMKVPTSGTSVFAPSTYTGNDGSNREITGLSFTPDLMLNAMRSENGSGRSPSGFYWFDRLRGKGARLRSSQTLAEYLVGPAYEGVNFQSYSVDAASGESNYNPALYVSHLFKRAPSFFDEVCYTGTGNNNTSITHNLAVVPELILVKDRSAAIDWGVYHQATGQAYAIYLNQSSAAAYVGDFWGTTAFTSTTFRVGNYSALNTNTEKYVAYLFATCAGVSKVGSYTGTGSTQTISCGFTGGARFVLIKRTDSTGNWFVWDTARGMVSGNDPRLAFNSIAAELSGDWVYATTGGFQIVTTDASVNASGGTYIFLAIA